MEAKSKFCGPCSRLDVLGTITKRASLSDSSETGQRPYDFPWHENLDAVNESAALCTLCQLVMKGWRESREIVVADGMASGDFEDPPEDLLFDIMDIEAYRRIGVGAVTLGIDHQTRDIVDSRQIRDVFLLSIKYEVVGGIASWEAHGELMAEFRVTFDPDYTAGLDTSLSGAVIQSDRVRAPDKLVQEVVATNPLSERSLKIANDWLETCVKTHGEALGTLSWEGMPTRVLEIVSDDRICLRVSRDSKPADGRYVALSHCWGITDTPFITTKSNFDDRMIGIGVEEMPQTFSDAVKVVRSLGLRYLWIDSLCIIQKDLEDWQIESAKMADVYRDAYLVLGAATGVSDASGFLRPRKVQDTVKFESNLYLQLLPPPSRRWTLYDRNALDPLAAEPLSRRAWCLQERYLPRRSLQYGSHQMFWECECIRASEDGDVVARKDDYLKSLSDSGTAEESVFHRVDRDPGSESENAKWMNWYQMSGKRNCSEHSRLTWCRKAPDQTFGRSDEYVAPSWSWASVQGPVQFPIYSWNLTRAPWKSRMADFEALAQYVSHTAKLRDMDMYGRLEGASLCIKAPLLQVVSIKLRPSDRPIVEYVFGQGPHQSPVTDKLVELQLQGQRFWIEGGFDFVDEDHSDLAVVFLTRLPHILEDGFVEHRFGLLVDKLDNGTYRRVGFVDGSILEMHRDAISRWKKYIPELKRHQGEYSNEQELNESIVEGLASFEAIERGQVKSGTADELEIVGYPRKAEDDHDVYEIEPPNKLAQNPLVMENTELTLV
ncbi:hypothetical protein QQZ08_000526 [Neonectria magnoliae]|uniref:Heterokaryon incompatibility domain-containing protein n=1 Tax=Neonectria magnoliae TaxID=2732573 RepID=A0ABR1IK36_9HYPO